MGRLVWGARLKNLSHPRIRILVERELSLARQLRPVTGGGRRFALSAETFQPPIPVRQGGRVRRGDPITHP